MSFNITNPKWQNTEHSRISYLLDGNLQVVILPPQTEQQITIVSEIESGIHGKITEYTPDEPQLNTADENRQIALENLVSTDWINQSDVYDEMSVPRLLNREWFLQYRALNRTIFLNPPMGNINWPILPRARWSSAE